LIEALEATLAPFVWHEKPQLSPRHAAIFIKNRPHIGAFPAAWRGQGFEDVNRRMSAAGIVMPLFIGVSRRSDAQQL
jgi:hypothetical protein